MARLKHRSPSSALLLGLALVTGLFLQPAVVHAQQPNDWVDVPDDWDADYRAAMQATADNDQGRSCRLFQPYASAGDAIAQYFVGTCLINGALGRTSVAEGISMIRTSADAGFFLAQFDYGTMNVKGEQVPKNIQAGIAYFMRAAKQGFGPAQVRLAANLAGLGDGYSNLKAMEWVFVAINGGVQGADLDAARTVHSFLQKRLDRDDIAFASSQAQKFVKQLETPPQVTKLASGKGKMKVVSRPPQKQETFGENDKPAFPKLDTSGLKPLPQAANPQQIPAGQAAGSSGKQAAIPDVVVSNAAVKFDEVYRQGGMMGVHAAVLDCYKGLLPGADINSLGFCITLDALSASVDAGVAKQMNMPPTPGFEPQVVMNRIRARLQPVMPSENIDSVVTSVVSRGNKYFLAILDQRDAGRSANSPQQSSRAAAPSISVTPAISTVDQTAEISGKIFSGGKIASLTIDGSDAPYKSDGTFSFPRAVPIGQSTIRLVAVDEWGQRGEATIKVVRSIASTIPDYPALAPAKVKAKPRPNAVALIIGVDAYQNIPRAEFAENDARYFYDYAINALGVPKDRIKLLTGAEARKLDVEKALLTWLKPLVAGGKSDVYVFFSGHGLASDDGRDLFLLPYDGDRSLLDRSAIRRKELVDAIVGAGAASATLFLDTCYSGGTRSGETLVASARPVLLAAKEEAVPANVTILTAAANDQLSSTLPATGHGLFSYYLMRGLEGEASGGGRSLTASDLLGYLSSRIPPEAAKLGRSQTPQVVGDGNRVISTW
jgi:hypothetical protein